MATTTELLTKLTVDDTAFKRAMSGASSVVSGLATTTKYAAGIITASLGGAFYGLISILNETEERVSKLVDTATRLGVGVRPLQRLQYAAKQSGISVESLNSGLGKLLKNTELAAEGNETLVGAFAKLSLNASELKSVGIDEEYIAISKAITKIKDPAQQALIATQLFGKGGIEQLSLLKDNVGGLVDEFKGLGTELTDDQAKSIESYGDSIGKLGATWEGFTSQLSGHLAGPLGEFAKWISTTVEKMGGMSQVAKFVAKFIVDAFLGVVTVFNKISDSVTKVRIGLTQFAVWQAKSDLQAAENAKDRGFWTEEGKNQNNVDIADFKAQIAMGEKMIGNMEATLGSSKLQKTLEQLADSMMGARTDVVGGSGTLNGKPFPGLNDGPSGTINGQNFEVTGAPTFIINGKAVDMSFGQGEMFKDGKPIKLDVNINADSGLIAKVVNSDQNQVAIKTTINNEMQSAASEGQR